MLVLQRVLNTSARSKLNSPTSTLNNTSKLGSQQRNCWDERELRLIGEKRDGIFGG